MTIAFPSEETSATTTSTAPTNRLSEISNPPSPPKKPLSPKKLAANRANAQKSTGPRTQEGKNTVSQNAKSHGLSAEKAPDFTNHDFWQAYEELKAEHRPTSPTQTQLLREINHVVWKLHQIPKIEFQLLNTPLTLDVESSASDSSFIRPPSSLPQIIASHFQQNAPTPLTRIFNHQLRLQSKLTSLLHHYRQAKKHHQKHQEEQTQIDANLERSRQRAHDDLTEQMNRIHQANKQKEQEARKARQQQLNQQPTTPPPQPFSGRACPTSPTPPASPIAPAPAQIKPTEPEFQLPNSPPAKNKPTPLPLILAFIATLCALKANAKENDPANPLDWTFPPRLVQCPIRPKSALAHPGLIGFGIREGGLGRSLY